MVMLARGRRDNQHMGDRHKRSRELYETAQNLELSVRLATPPYQPVDTIADCDQRESRASDRSWSAMDAATVPIAEGRRRSIIQHISSSCGTCCRQHDKKDLENRKHALFPFLIPWQPKIV
jgi:hypothetical protein